MAGGSSIAAGPSSVGAPPAGPPAEKDPGRRRRYLVAAGFLLPASRLPRRLGRLPDDLHRRSGASTTPGATSFVGIDNYKTLFTTDVLLTAIKNNAIWVLVVPALVTAIGLVFAVLTERIRWSVAFKTAVFMPMAISLFAAGVIWHIMYTQDPSQGTLNAAVRVVKDAVNPPGVLSGATPSTDILQGSPKKGFAMAKGVQPGQVAVLGLTGIPPSDVKGGQQAVAPSQQQGAITGVVWRDFKPGGGKPGKVEQGEIGIPGVTLALLDASGKQVATTTTQGGRHVRLPVAVARARTGSTSRPRRSGSPTPACRGSARASSRPSIIIAYIWVWAGFAMVVIAAGLASIPRDVLEAARTDGATEWQVFRRVTVPLLAPVLSVVFITMIINVLKVFDIVLSVAPASVQDDANVIALAMWRTAFGGVNDFGLGSAIAVFLFILVIPVLLLNVRRFRREA